MQELMFVLKNHQLCVVCGPDTARFGGRMV